jgi:transcriptional regulator with GAF, ATPase, and Fis domain
MKSPCTNHEFEDNEIYVDSDYTTGKYNLLKFERKTIIKALLKTNNNKRAAARLLEITVPTLNDKIYKHSINYNDLK